MARDLSVAVNILARDHASRNLDKVGNAAQRTGKKFGGLSGRAALAGGIVGAAVVKMAFDSVKEFARAEEAQAKLSDAFARFPKLADSNIDRFRKLNTALAQKTRFDDDATAAAQANLAQFNLTGKQIETLTPLLQDYAAKTGQLLPDAATNLGRALLGNARALKTIGISLPKATDGAKLLTAAQGKAAQAEDQLYGKRRRLSDLQTVLHSKDKLTVADRVHLRTALDDVRRAEDKHKAALLRVKDAQKGAAKTGDLYSQIVKGLRTQVGGFATKEGQTAAGKLEIMRNKFGEVKEQVGAKLLPILINLADYMNTTLIPAFSKLVDFIGDHSSLFKAISGIALAFYLIVKAQKAVLAFQTVFRGKMVAEAVLTSREIAVASAGKGRGAGVGVGLAGKLPMLGLGAAIAGGSVPDLENAKDITSKYTAKQILSSVDSGNISKSQALSLAKTGGMAPAESKKIIDAINSGQARVGKSIVDNISKLFPPIKTQSKAASDTTAEVKHMTRLAQAQAAKTQGMSDNIAALVKKPSVASVIQNFYNQGTPSADALMRQAVYRFGRNGKAFA